MTSPQGAGLQPLGSSPLGTAQPRAVPALAIPGQPSDRTLVRGLDPRRGDWAWSEAGGTVVFAPIGATLQRVVLALATVRASIAGNPARGNRALSLGKDSGALATEVRNAVEGALANLASEGAIQIEAIPVERQGTALLFGVEYLDLATRQRVTSPQEAL